MTIEVIVDVLPGDALPTYDVEISTRIMSYDFAEGRWEYMEEAQFFNERWKTMKTMLSREEGYDTPDDIQEMLIEAFNKSPAFVFFLNISIERRAIGLWVPDSSHHFLRAPRLTGTPEQVASGLHPYVVALSVMES